MASGQPGFNVAQLNQNEEEVLKLQQEFKKLDLDGDGRVDQNEMAIYLQRKGIDEEHRAQIVDELFSKCDQDMNGKIDINEFTANYVDTKNQLLIREYELKQSIIDVNLQVTQNETRLQQLRSQGQSDQNQPNQLKVEVQKATNLGANESGCQVVVHQENASQETKVSFGRFPEFNQGFLFFVTDERHPLVIELMDVAQNTHHMRTQITFDQIKEPNFPLGKDFWLNEKEYDDDAAKVLMRFEYVEQDIPRMEREIVNLKMDLQSEVQLLQQVKIFIDQLATPFGFLTKTIQSIQEEIKQEGIEDSINANHIKGDHRYYQQEKRLEAKFDLYTTNLARKYKYEEVPWALVTKIVLAIYFVFTAFSMFIRPDFLSITAIALGIYVTECPKNVKWSTFRNLVLLVAFTFVFDILFLLFLHDSEADDQQNMGMLTNTRRFAYFFAWISVLFRPIVIMVLWKDSLDCRRILRDKLMVHATDEEMGMAQGGNSLDNQVRSIVNQNGLNVRI